MLKTIKRLRQPLFFGIPKTPLSLLFPSILWYMPAQGNERKVYLTIDDGPCPKATDFVLDELGKENLKATFFFTGKALETFPNLAQKTMQSHKIGMHGFAHLNGWQCSTKKYFADLTKCAYTFEKILGETPELFRPPYGKLPLRAFLNFPKQYQIVLWSVMSHDYNNSLAHHMILERLKKATSSGAIIVFHDNPKAFPCLKFVFPKYLKFLSEEGYTLESL